MKCPSCGATVEDGSDLCLECGEPMGESPAARVARQDNVIRPPPQTFAPTAPPAPPTVPGKTPPAPPTVPGKTPPAPPTVPGKTSATKPPVARKKWPAEEPEPKRCPGCGTRTLAARCPGCGTKLHSDDD